MTTNDASETAVPPCFPRRRDDLHVEELDGEAVLYDPRNGAIHRFNTTTFSVWSACDGSRTPRDIADGLMKHHPLGADEALNVVRHVIALIEEKGLFHDVPCAAGGSVDEVEFALTKPDIEAPYQATIAEGSASPPSAAPAPETAGHGLSRRELLGGGVSKAVLAAPVISTFFAAGAYASGPSASGAFGPGGCKESQYSCFIDTDCCQAPANRKCEAGMCCVKLNQPCDSDSDSCSSAGSGCLGGICRP